MKFTLQILIFDFSTQVSEMFKISVNSTVFSKSVSVINTILVDAELLEVVVKSRLAEIISHNNHLLQDNTMRNVRKENLSEYKILLRNTLTL